MQTVTRVQTVAPALVAPALVALVWANTANAQVDVDVDLGGQEWYENPWVWVGVAVFLLILVLIMRRR